MKLSISFLVSFILLSSHLNFADAKKAGKEARKKHAENVINNLFDDDEDDYVIVFKKGYKHEKTEAAALTRNANGKLYKDTSGGFSGRFNSQAIGELKNNPNVAYIEKDVQVSINVDCTIQNNPVPSWGLDRIDSSNLDSKYSYDVNGPDQEVHVYVIDTGINSGHNDFVGRRLGEHFGAVGNVAETSDGTFTSGSWEDCNGHGTHVAGTVGGTQYGVAKNANIILHAVRVLNCDGMGYVSDIMEAYDWVIDQCTNKICVANGSFGGGFSQAGNDGAASLVEAGIVFAVAAGNGNSDACTATPASAEGVITVGATTKTDVRSSFSNHGECVDIFAPGSAITSAWIGGNSAIATLQGTSMASPHVAGVAALIRQLYPALTPAEVTRMIETQALADRIMDVRPGSPNLLLQVPPLDCDLPPPCSYPFELSLMTDQYGSETSWELEDPSGSIVASGPPSGTQYDNNSLYSETVCIDVGEYIFTIYDTYGDGICCSYGEGWYSLKVGDDEVMLQNGGLFDNRQRTSFDVQASDPSTLDSPSPTISPSVSPTSSPSDMPTISPSVSPSSSPSDAPKFVLLAEKAPTPNEADLDGWEKVEGGPVPTMKTWIEYSTEEAVCGSWEATVGTYRASYSSWEFGHLIAGRIIITPDGRESYTVEAGDSFVVEKDFVGTWKIEATALKHFCLK